jgi:hypothetical protein
MASASFDITSTVDLQEVDNAVNQAKKEIAQRYDFKGSKSSIELKKAENLIELIRRRQLQDGSRVGDSPDADDSARRAGKKHEAVGRRADRRRAGEAESRAPAGCAG